MDGSPLVPLWRLTDDVSLVRNTQLNWLSIVLGVKTQPRVACHHNGVKENEEGGCRRKQIMVMIIAEIHKTDTTKRTDGSKSWFFKRINKTNKPSSKYTKRKEKSRTDAIWNEKGWITIDIIRTVRRCFKTLCCNKLESPKEKAKFAYEEQDWRKGWRADTRRGSKNDLMKLTRISGKIKSTNFSYTNQEEREDPDKIRDERGDHANTTNCRG